MSRAPAGPIDDRPVRTGSLRLRVASGVLMLLVCTLAGLGFAVNVLLRNALVDDLRTRLEDRAGFAALLQEQGVTGQTLADKTSGQGVVSTFTAGGTQWVGRPGQSTDGGQPGPRPAGIRPRPAVTPTVSYTESDGSLTAGVTLRDGTLQLQTSEAEIDRTLSELTRIELIAGGGMVAVTALLLWGVVGRALRPLHRMTSLAARIRDGARGRRLRPTRPGTDIGRTAVTIDQMLDSLEAAEAAAREAERRMRQFLADASHDLRTPLAGVIAGSEHLLRSPQNRAATEDQLVAVVRQARRAARLVDDLLLITRLDAGAAAASGQVRLAVDLSSVAAAEVRAIRLRFPQLPIDVMATGPLVVSGDPDQLARAVGNVIDNAARAGGPVRITIDSSGATVRLIVSDCGPGVPDVDRERIFDRFVRLEGSRSGPGSGLGLPISRGIARAHGGDLAYVDRPPGTGAMFELTVPALVLGGPPMSPLVLRPVRPVPVG